MAVCIKLVWVIILLVDLMLQISGTGTFCGNPEIELPIVIGTKPIDDLVLHTTPPDEYIPFAPSALTDIDSNIHPTAPQINEIPDGDAVPSYTTVGKYCSNSKCYHVVFLY